MMVAFEDLSTVIDEGRMYYRAIGIATMRVIDLLPV